MNNPFAMICVIVALVIIADLIKSYMKRREQKSETTDDELGETMARMDLLEERIRVLERIVTDRPYDLKKQIDNL